MTFQKKYISYFSIFISLFFLSCSSVPLTGRKQMSFIPNSTMLTMSIQQYDEFLKSNKLSDNQEQTQMVKRAGKNIQEAVEQYFAQNNMSNELKNYAWEFNLVESDDVNAWAMPGGKVVVYTGILPIAQDETGLAVVMGHEVAHAIAKHGSERMSQEVFYQLGGTALAALTEGQSEMAKQAFSAAYGYGAQYGVLLPYSRLHESEADHLGLIFMAMGGYDPNAAVDFWQRMSETKGGKTVPEFMSTHPSDETRIRKIKEMIPEAMQYYQHD
ncbi:MAG: M48 family metallopeptidase [Planctomycetes bacterium]|nr:M48 family metallopeptidase [Planctomycetota bacterium]